MKRIYLDTAFLADMADGKNPPAVVDRFRRALVNANAVLVISHAHLIDVSRADDPGTRSRMTTFLDGLDCVVIATVGPREVEDPVLEAVRNGSDPVDDAARDITFRRVTSIGEEMIARRGDDVYKAIGGLMSQTADAERASQDAARNDPPMTKERRGVVEDAMVRLVRGEPFEQMIKEAEAANGGLLDPAVRAQFLALAPQFAAIAPMLRQLIADAGGTPMQFAKTSFRPGGAKSDVEWAAMKGGEERWLAVAPTVAPGTYLAAQLRALRRGNLTREIKDSDGADLEHAMYLPYVDLASSDADNVARLARPLQVARLRDGFQFLPNGKVNEVLSTIEQFAAAAV